LLRIQDVVFQVQPDVIVETGVAHGGSLIFYASVCHALGNGRVIGIDISITAHNRTAIERHPMSRYISLVEGSSIDPDVVARVKALISPDSTVLVVLDSNHSYHHVMQELRAYAHLVSPGSYVVVADGIMRELAEVKGGNRCWSVDNPARAALDFLREHSEFVLEAPRPSFNESSLREFPTYWPQGWLKRVR
jgi:cephalosporin hydroxylase